MSLLYFSDALVVEPPCCRTPHIVAAYVRCAGADYDPNAINAAPRLLKCAACGALVKKDSLTQIGTIAKRRPPAEPDWESVEVPEFLRLDGESSREFHERVLDTRTDQERSADPALPPEFLKA